MAILVTGGAGYIGSHTCVELLNAGEDIVVLDNFYNSEPEVVGLIQEITGKEFPFYEVDLLDLDGVRKVFKENDIESVIHFAGYKAVGESVEKPLQYYHNNMTGTFNLCQAMLEFDCHRIVFSSSATVYGTSLAVPYTEDTPTSATNPYGWTKVMLEQVLKDVAVANPNWSVVLLRYFNPVGAHPSGLIGESPRGIPNNLVPYIAKVAAGELPHLNVTGHDFDTPDGTGVRDYIHVMDLASGHLAAVKYARESTGSEAINLGTGHGYSVLEVLKAYEKACGKELPYELKPRRAGDMAESYANPSKAKELLYGWEAQYDIDDMMETSWKFTSHYLED